MNSIMKESYPLFEMYQDLRKQLMDLLTDDDLAFKPSGDNPSLGRLCREIGEVEYAYIQSFKLFRQDFSYRQEDILFETRVAPLIGWYAQLDAELKKVISALSEEDIQTRVIDRGGGFTLPPRLQLEVYKEALLIFYGKASVYLKAIGKSLPDQWREWIG